MLGLDAFRRKPRSFGYKPVYFDPVKDERDQRKFEILGDQATPTEDNAQNYVAGQYIRANGFARKRTQIADRGLDQAHRQRNIRRGVIALILLFVALYYLLT